MKTLHLVGFGSQGAAWAECLRDSGWDVRVYMPNPGSGSFTDAVARGFRPEFLGALPGRISSLPDGKPALVALLCPDTEIARTYREHLAAVGAPLTIILAHGFAVYAAAHASEYALAPSPQHELALLAPKAIGPKLRAEYLASRPHHRLVAAFHCNTAAAHSDVVDLAQGLGFAPENLVAADFRTEAVGDLISEQVLLCGGVFFLLERAMRAMAAAGVPERLVREECLSELELIAGLIREKGPAAAFGQISRAAQAGTIAMGDRMERLGLDQAIGAQVDEIVSGRFAGWMREHEAHWTVKAPALARRLTTAQSPAREAQDNSAPSERGAQA